MDVVSEPVRTMVWLSLLTGLRIGEVLGLPWKNVDFTSGHIRVTQAFYRGTIGSPKTKCSKRDFDPEGSPNGFNQAPRELEARGRGIGVPHCERNTVQRLQPASSVSETGRPKAWHALAQLAHPTANSHHVIPGGGR